MTDRNWLVPPADGAAVPDAGQPRFSVVIATYEAASTVADAVESAFAQTHPAHEIIVVDDGSTDHPEQSLRPYLDRIKLIRKSNGGGASALNTGIEAAAGDFLAILDADDTYHPRRLEALAALANARPDLDLVTTDAAFVIDDEVVGRFSEHTPFAITGQRTAIFASCFVGGWPAVRLSALRARGGFDEDLRTGYDWECWGRLILAGSRAGMDVEPLYRYRLHSGTLTSDRASSLWDRVTVLEKLGEGSYLDPDELAALARALRVHRSRAVLAEAQDSLYGPAKRRQLLPRVLMRGIRPFARVAVLATCTVPPLARRLVPEHRPAEERLATEAR